jgi:hypothetical protein
MSHLHERIDFRRIAYLKQKASEINDTYFAKEKNKAEREKWIKQFSNFVTENLKKNGNRIVHYEMPDTTIEAFGNRQYASRGIQSVPAAIRGFLVRGYTTDVDAKNCHPTILEHLCKENHIPCHHLSEYIQNRDFILSNNFKSTDEGKLKILVSMNSQDAVQTKNVWFKQFDIEMKNIQHSLFLLPQYEGLRKIIPAENDSNIRGSLLNRICCGLENQIITHASTFMQSKNIEVFAKCFDGLLIYGDHYANTALLQELQSYIGQHIPNLNLPWAFKQHSNEIQMPDDYVPPSAETLLCEDLNFHPDYLAWKSSHELEWAKIRETGSFIKARLDDDGNFQNYIYQTETALITAYKEITFTTTTDNVRKKHQCIKVWLTDQNIRVYDYAQVIPPPKVCPKNVFNLWSPFKYQHQPIDPTDADYHSEFVELFKRHLHIMCNNEQLITNYVLHWIAHAFQCPAVKPECAITLVGSQGTGKSTVISVIEKLMGGSKVLQTATPERDVWGNFNSGMASAYFVVLTEFGRASYGTSGESQFKKLVTDHADGGFIVNVKGKDQFTINSYHRVWADSNKLDQINTDGDDRRNKIIRVSDELKGNKAYFNTFYEMMQQPNALRSLFWFLYTLSFSEWDARDTIKTEFHEVIVEATRNPIHIFIEHLATTYHTVPIIERTPTELLADFRRWRELSGYTFGEKTNAASLIKQIKLSQCFPDEYMTSRKSNGIRYTALDLEKIRPHMGLDNPEEMDYTEL